MTDKELLELAAKAAGIHVWFPRMSDGKGGVVTPCHTETIGEGTVQWNPLTDDGNALRLAVKLGLIVDTHGLYTIVGLPFENAKGHEPHGADPYAATRRAITRAAAEIGKSMKDDTAPRTLSRLSDERGEEL